MVSAHEKTEQKSSGSRLSLGRCFHGLNRSACVECWVKWKQYLGQLCAIELVTRHHLKWIESANQANAKTNS